MGPGPTPPRGRSATDLLYFFPSEYFQLLILSSPIRPPNRILQIVIPESQVTLFKDNLPGPGASALPAADRTSRPSYCFRMSSPAYQVHSHRVVRAPGGDEKVVAQRSTKAVEPTANHPIRSSQHKDRIRASADLFFADRGPHKNYWLHRAKNPRGRLRGGGYRAPPPPHPHPIRAWRAFFLFPARPGHASSVDRMRQARFSWSVFQNPAPTDR